MWRKLHIQVINKLSIEIISKYNHFCKYLESYIWIYTHFIEYEYRYYFLSPSL